MCQNPLLNKITPATDICDRGDFHILVFRHIPFFLFPSEFLCLLCNQFRIDRKSVV